MSLTTVLLIDDDRDDRELFSEVFEEIDPAIQCITQGNCVDAVAYLKHNPTPDFIFLDLNMPAINGLQCLIMIKKQPSLQETPVIIYSTSKNPEDIELTKKMGGTLFLTKPGHLKELKDELLSIVRRYQV